MNREIEVRNLAVDISEDDVKKLLAVVGRTLKIEMIPMQRSVKARVTLSVSDEATEAMRKLDHSRFLGRTIRVVLAKKTLKK